MHSLRGLLARLTKVDSISPRSSITGADVLVSGFNEDPPNYPGGIWRICDDHVEPVYQGYGVFGLSLLAQHNLVFGVTRVEDPQLLVFKVSASGEYLPLRVDYRGYISARRAHGIYIFKDKLYVVATQGDPDAVYCTNPDYAEHRVGKVIISDLEIHSDHVVVKNSQVWNPYNCDHHHHYNDILVNDGYIFLASFSTCERDRTYVPRGSVTRFSHNHDEAEVVTDELFAPHSLQISEGKLFICSSGNSAVVSVPASEVRARTRLEFKTLNNFVRGLHISSDYFLIGLSRSAGRTNSAHLTDSINGILMFNRQDGTTARIEMPADCDNLYSVLSLSDLEQA